MPPVKKLQYHDLLKKALDGRTNKWLHLKTGISEGEISRIINGRLTPSKDQVEKISKAFPFDFTTN